MLNLSPANRANVNLSKLTALLRVDSINSSRKLIKATTLLFCCLIIVLFLPWTQNIQSNGNFLGRKLMHEIAIQIKTIDNNEVWVNFDEIKQAYERFFRKTYLKSPIGPLQVEPIFPQPPFEVTCTTYNRSI